MKAMDWIEQHKNDADFEEELFIVVQQPGAAAAGGTNSMFAGLTKEEKLAKAKELQQQIRARKAKEEAAMAFENEQARKKADKELAAAKRLADEQ